MKNERPLSRQREAFAQAVADGLSGADAYRKCYDASRTKDKVVYVKASELMADAKVKARILELKQKLSDRQLWTREQSVKALRSIVEQADNQNVLIGAVKELNAMHGYNAPTKTEITGANGGPIQVTEIKRVIVDPKQH